MGDEPARHVSSWLMLGMLSLPMLFVWLLLRPGYARSTRVAAFTYTFFFPALWLVGALILCAIWGVRSLV